MNRLRLLNEALVLSERLLQLADREVEESDAEPCLLLAALLRDSGFKIRRMVEQMTDDAQNG